MDVFPAYVPLAGRTVAMVGEGEAVQAKARLFAGSPATLVWLDGERALDSDAYAGVALAFVAGHEAFASLAAAAARRAGALVNVVDKPHLSDFQTPSIVSRGAVVGAIGTGGAAPVLASRLRNVIEAQWPEGLGRVADLLRTLQPEIRAHLPDLDQRRAYLRDQLDGPAAAAAMAGEMDRALALARAALDAPSIRPGVIWRLAAPASADLITLRALRVLGRADRIVASPKADPALLALARRDAPRFEPAKAPPEVLAAWIAEGLEIVYVDMVGEEGDRFEAARRLGATVHDLC